MAELSRQRKYKMASHKTSLIPFFYLIQLFMFGESCALGTQQEQTMALESWCPVAVSWDISRNDHIWGTCIIQTAQGQEKH